MSDFDLYPGQGCRCGNDPMCHNCGSGAAYEAQIAQEEAAKQAQEEAYAEAMREQAKEHYDEIARGIAAGNVMEQDEPQNIVDTCCGKCGPGLCYVDQVTGEASEGWGWQR